MGQVPPPFYGPPPPRQNNSGVIVAVVVGGLLLVFGFCAFGAYALFNKGVGFARQVGTAIANEVVCDENFSATRQAILDYAKNNNGKLPEAAKWQDQVRQYVRRELSSNDVSGFPNLSNPNDRRGTPRLMSADGDWGCYVNGSSTGMAYNSDLSGKKLADVKDPDDTILIYEIPAPATNASGSYKSPSTPGVSTGTGFRSWKLEYVHQAEKKHADFNNDDESDSSSSDSGSKAQSKSDSSDNDN